MIAEYSIIWRDRYASQFRRDITGLVQSVDVTRVVNTVGSLTIVIGDLATAIQMREDDRFYLYQSYPGRPPELIGETWYRLRKITITQDEHGLIQITLKCEDLVGLLDTRIVAYASGTAQAAKSVIALDVMLKEIVRENLGADAVDTDRSLDATIFSVQIDISVNYPAVSKAFAWRQVLMVLQEIAQASGGGTTFYYFDVVATSETTCEFRVYMEQRGRDRRAGSGQSGGFILSPQRGNIINPVYSKDWTEECTNAYAGGQGEGAARVVETASDDFRAGISPFNRRERFVDARHTDDSGDVFAEAAARIIEGRPVETFRGEIRETDASLFQVQYAFGDYVTAEFLGMTFDCRLNAYNLKVARQHTGQTFNRTMSMIAVVDQPYGTGGID